MLRIVFYEESSYYFYGSANLNKLKLDEYTTVHFIQSSIFISHFRMLQLEFSHL